MKILFSCLSRSWGGMEMFAVTSVEQLLNRNIQTELLCYPDSPIYKNAIEKGITVHTVKARSYFHPVLIIKIALLIKKGRFDIIHTGGSKDLWILSPSLWLVSDKIPLLLTKQMGSFIVKKDFLHKLIYNRLTYALAISEVIRRNLLDTCPIDEQRILLQHNSVDTKKFDPSLGQRDATRKEFDIKGNEIIIGMLGRFSPGKGHEEFVEAARILSGKYESVRFMIVGEPSVGEDSYGKVVTDLVEKFNLQDRIIFTGFRSDTQNVLAAMDIFAFPSHSEAFGIALIEAMSMGKPTVCSNSDGVLDIAVDGKTSYLFQKQDARDLAEKLTLLIESKEKREQMGTAGRKRVVENFDVVLQTDKVIDIYKKSLKGVQ